MTDEIKEDVERFLESNHLDGSGEVGDGMEKDAELITTGALLTLVALAGTAGAGAYGYKKMTEGSGGPSYEGYDDRELEGWKKLAPLAAAGVGAYALDQYMRGYDSDDEEGRINPWERSEMLKELEGDKSASVELEMQKSAAFSDIAQGLLFTLPFGLGLAGGYFVGDAMDPDHSDKKSLMNKELATYYAQEADKARMRAAELLANQRA